MTGDEEDEILQKKRIAEIKAQREAELAAANNSSPG